MSKFAFRIALAVLLTTMAILVIVIGKHSEDQAQAHQLGITVEDVQFLKRFSNDPGPYQIWLDSLQRRERWRQRQDIKAFVP